MSELTFTKQENGLYRADYINGEWVTFYNVTKADKKKADVGLLYDKYEGV